MQEDTWMRNEKNLNILKMQLISVFAREWFEGFMSYQCVAKWKFEVATTFSIAEQIYS